MSQEVIHYGGEGVFCASCRWNKYVHVNCETQGKGAVRVIPDKLSWIEANDMTQAHRELQASPEEPRSEE